MKIELNRPELTLLLTALSVISECAKIDGERCTAIDCLRNTIEEQINDEVIVTPYRSAGAAIAFDICGRGQVLRDIVKIKQTDDEFIFIDSEGRENHVAKKLIDIIEVVA